MRLKSFTSEIREEKKNEAKALIKNDTTKHVC